MCVYQRTPAHLMPHSAFDVRYYRIKNTQAIMGKKIKITHRIKTQKKKQRNNNFTSFVRGAQHNNESENWFTVVMVVLTDRVVPN